jgi:hypothetical protein
MEHFFQGKYELGMWELQNDVLFNRIAVEQYHELIDFAWNTGYKTAKEYITKYETSSPTEMLNKLGLTLLELNDGYISPEYRILSEYFSNMKRIVLYKSTIIEEVKKLKNLGISGFDEYTHIRELFIAHEIFHHIECHDQGLTSKQKKIVTFRWGPFTLTSGVRALCEIGAHSFAKTLLNLSGG